MENEFKYKLKDWDKVPVKSMELTLSQGEKFHAKCLEIADKISQRAIWCVGLFIPLAVAIVSFQGLSNAWLVVIVVLLLVNFVLLLSIVLPRVEWFPGFEPRSLSPEEFLENKELNDDQAYLALVIAEVENVQNSIDNTVRQNQRRSLILKISLFLIAVTYLIVGIFHLLTSIS